MKASVLICLLALFLPIITFSQDYTAFNSLRTRLAYNAKYPDPVPREGSKQLRSSLSTYAGIIKDSIKKSQILEYRALSSLKQGDYDLAFADYENASQLNPKLRGQVGWRYLFFLHDYPRALTHLIAFDALTPEQDDPIDDYSVSYLKGRAYAGLNKHQEAIDAYTTAISNRELRYGSEWVDYRYFVARAVSYLATQQPKKALLDLDKAIKNTPKSSMAHFHRGRALQAIDRYNEARDAFRDALFFVRSQPFERDFYYEQPDAAYEEQIESALSLLKK